MKRRDTYRNTSGNMTPVSNLQRVRHLVDVTGDYPLEVGLAVWAAGIGITSLTVGTPSGSLSKLPSPLDTGWAIIMLVAAFSTAYGLRTRLVSPAIANSMFLFCIAFAAYSITVSVVNGWATGGAVAGLTAVLSVVCYLRSRRLRDLWKILVAEGERLHNTGSIPKIEGSEPE